MEIVPFELGLSDFDVVVVDDAVEAIVAKSDVGVTVVACVVVVVTLCLE